MMEFLTILISPPSPQLGPQLFWAAVLLLGDYFDIPGYETHWFHKRQSFELLWYPQKLDQSEPQLFSASRHLLIQTSCIQSRLVLLPLLKLGFVRLKSYSVSGNMSKCNHCCEDPWGPSHGIQLRLVNFYFRFWNSMSDFQENTTNETYTVKLVKFKLAASNDCTCFTLVNHRNFLAVCKIIHLRIPLRYYQNVIQAF